MLEFLSKTPGTVSFAVTGRITAEDIECIYEKVDEALSDAAAVHLYAEIEDFSGLDLEALRTSLSHGAKLLGQLGRLGRIAVVSEHKWIRTLARFESAVLPKVTYRIFEPDQRAAALDWVEGREDLPYGHAMRVIDTDSDDVMGFEIDGHIGRAEMDAFAHQVNAKSADHAPRGVLVRYKSYRGIDPSAVFDREYIKMKLGLMDHLERYAVVGAPDWMREMVGLARAAFDVDFQTFDLDDEDDAWEWLGAKPALNRQLDAE